MTYKKILIFFLSLQWTTADDKNSRPVLQLISRLLEAQCNVIIKHIPGVSTFNYSGLYIQQQKMLHPGVIIEVLL
jgi:hypothetical protein